MTSKRQKKSGYPIPEPIDNGSRICVKFEIPDAPEYRRAVKSQLQELGLWGLWDKSYTIGDRRATDAAELFRRLLFKTLEFGDCDDCPDMLDFRQNPTNDCLLQYSKDGGDTWIDMFDYSKCIPQPTTGEVSNYATTATGELNRLRTTYNGTVQSIYTQGVWDGGGDGATRNSVLCYASWSFVNSSCEAGIAALDQDESFVDTLLNIAAVAFGLAGAIVSFFASLGNPIIALAIGYAVMSAAFALLALADNVSAAVFEDLDVRQNLICCMYDALEGTTPTQENWTASLDNCDYEAGSDEEKMRLFLVGMLGNQDVYLTFLQAMDDAFTLIQAGINQPGDCECPIEIDLVQDNYPSIIQNMGGNRWRVTATCVSGNPTTKGLSVKDANGNCFQVSNYTANFIIPNIPSSDYFNCAGASLDGNVPDGTYIKRVDYLLSVGCSPTVRWIEFTVTDVIPS